MRILMTVVASFCTMAAIAESVATPPAVAGKKVSDGSNFRMRVSGGMVKKPGSASGKVLFLNAQTRVPMTAIVPAVNEIEKRLHPDTIVKTHAPVDVAGVGSAVRSSGAQIGVVIVDVPSGVPALLTAPEEGWAVVNVAKLAAGEVSPEILAARTRKEILRAFGLVAGAAFMGADAVLLRADVRIPKDLDLIKDEMYGIDACRGMWTNMPRMGVVPWKVVTYRKACEEGWAASPTNKWQQAIWDKVHELPKKPLKLEK